MRRLHPLGTDGRTVGRMPPIPTNRGEWQGRTADGPIKDDGAGLLRRMERDAAEGGRTPLPVDTGPVGPNPAAAYLATLSPGSSRRAMQGALRTVASAFGCEPEGFPFTALRYEHLTALRAELADRYAPATCNLVLSVVRGVLRQAWLMEQVSGEDYHRAAAVPSVRGTRLPAGRALEPGEVEAVLRACADDDSPAGPRDGAAITLLYGSGLRRTEALSLELDDYDAENGALRVRGKGNRERLVFPPAGARAALADWLAARGSGAGPLLTRTDRAGVAGMSGPALTKRLQRRAEQAGVRRFSPHDLRRTFVSTALSAGADLALVQRLAGHASPTTTTRYDRRPDEAKREAAQLVHVPWRIRGDAEGWPKAPPRGDRGGGSAAAIPARSSPPRAPEVGGVRGAPDSAIMRQGR